MTINSNTRKKLLGHFVYQFNMLRRCFHRCMKSYLMNSKKGYDEDLMVAFLTNVSVFYEFFYKKHSDSGNAKDYLGKKWKVKRPLKGINKWNIQVNKYLFHLSYTRVTTDEGKHNYKGYDVESLYSHFRKLTLNFIAKLPTNFKTPELIELSETLKKEIDFPDHEKRRMHNLFYYKRRFKTDLV